jgi:hypothetical protein
VAPASGVPASAGSGVPGSMLLLRQASHRLKPGLQCGPGVGSPGFSRSRRSRQYAAAPAGIPPAKAGTPVWPRRRQSWLQPDQAFPAGEQRCIECTLRLSKAGTPVQPRRRESRLQPVQAFPAGEQRCIECTLRLSGLGIPVSKWWRDAQQRVPPPSVTQSDARPGCPGSAAPAARRRQSGHR